MSKNSREVLAAYAHDTWSGWMTYMFANGTSNADGTFTIAAWAVERWARQMCTPYDQLSEAEKMSDRDEADKILELLHR